MDLLSLLPTVIVIAKILYVGTAILQRAEDSRFEGDKIMYRS